MGFVPIHGSSLISLISATPTSRKAFNAFVTPIWEIIKNLEKYNPTTTLKRSSKVLLKNVLLKNPDVNP